MEIIELLDEVFRVYWKTCTEYLEKKRNNWEWIYKNLNWLNKIVRTGMATVNMEYGGRLLPLYQIMEENPELKEALYKACSKVLDKYAEVYNRAA